MAAASLNVVANQALVEAVNLTEECWALKAAVKSDLGALDIDADAPAAEARRALLKAVLSAGDALVRMQNKIAELHQRKQTLQNAVAASSANGRVELPCGPLAGSSWGLDAVVAASREWDRKVFEDFNAVIAAVRQPLAEARKGGSWSIGTTKSDAPPPMDSMEEGTRAPSPGLAAGGGAAMPGSTPVIGNSDEMLLTIAGMTSLNHAIGRPGMVGWGLVRVQLRTPTGPALQEMFSDLHPRHRQIGVDNELAGCEWFWDHRVEMCKAALDKGYSPLLAQYAKRGVPTFLRPQVWAAVLDPPSAAHHRATLACLIQSCSQTRMLVDAVLASESVTVCSSVDYFPFQDSIEQLSMLLCRDPFVATGCVAQPHTPLTGVTAARTPGETYPPSGVLPFQGLPLYAAPMMYLYPDAERAYFPFRAMFCRFWSCLNSLNGKEGTLIPLCRLFEELVHRYIPETVFHLLQMGVAPLRIAFPWIRYAFAGYLPPDQLLLLWDRLVGFGKTQVIPVFAAALFVFRSQALLRAANEKEVKLVFAECARIKVIPILQYFLFADQPA